MGTDRVELSFSEALEGDEEKEDLQDPGELCLVRLHVMSEVISTVYSENSRLDCHQVFEAPSSCNLFLDLSICFLFLFFSDYRYRKDEIFKRLKVTTFAQLVSINFYLLAIL